MNHTIETLAARVTALEARNAEPDRQATRSAEVSAERHAQWLREGQAAIDRELAKTQEAPSAPANIYGSDQHLLCLLEDLLDYVGGTPTTRINHSKEFVVLSEVVQVLRERQNPTGSL